MEHEVRDLGVVSRSRENPGPPAPRHEISQGAVDRQNPPVRILRAVRCEADDATLAVDGPLESGDFALAPPREESEPDDVRQRLWERRDDGLHLALLEEALARVPLGQAPDQGHRPLMFLKESPERLPEEGPCSGRIRT